MKNKFKRIPEILQKQILFRFIIGVAFFILYFVVQFCFHDRYLSLPCLLFSSVMMINGWLLFYNSVKGRFIRVQGVCTQIKTAGIRKRMKSILVDIESHTCEVLILRRIRNLNKGDTVIIYLSEKTPVYDRDNCYMICSYSALEIRKEV